MIVENYLELTKKWKKEYGIKSVVLMQVGSFFEIYALKDQNGIITGSDIEEISSYCDLLIAKKGQKIKDKQVIMAGFGLTQIDKYIKKIQELKYTCIIYTQDIQAPNTSRSLDKIISPGTYFGTEETDIVSNNISCIWINKEKKTKYYDEHVKIGFSSVDISSGKSIISQYESLYYKDPSTYDDIERQISITAPHESILVFKNFDDKDVPSIINYLGLSDKKYHLVSDDETELSISVNNSEKQKYQSQVMTLFFPNISPEIISEAFRSHEISMQSYTVLLNFIYKHNPNILKNISFANLEYYDSTLHLANHSLRQLNIINNDGINGKYKSIANLLNNCYTKMGKREFYYNLTHPSFDKELLTRKYKEIEVAIENNLWREIRIKLKGIKDIDYFTRKLSNNKLTPRDIAKLYDDLLIIKDIYEIINNDKYFKNNINLLDLNCIDFINEIILLIKNTFDIKKCYELDYLSGEKLGVLSPNDACFILPESDLSIKEILSNSDNYNIFLTKIQSYFSNLIGNYENKKKSTSFIKIHETPKSSPVLSGTNRRMQILLTALSKNNSTNINLDGDILELNDIKIENSGSNKKDQIVTSSQIKEICYGLQNSRENLIEQLNISFNKFCLLLENKIDHLSKIAKFTGWVDCLQNAAYIATTYDYSKPNIIDHKKSFFDIEQLRHPLIEQIQINETYVTNDLMLGKEEFNGILLYGTNAVGKSSFIKAIGICIIMAQAGLWVPCKNMNFYPYKKIFTRILGNDDLFKGLSTFAVEMCELRTILNHSDENSLIIGDEVCSGTESNSAKSIFTAAIEWLHNKNSSFIFATHFHEINKYEEIKNLKYLNKMHMSVIYDHKSDCLIYDRKLRQGPGEDMYGLEVCKALSLHDSFLEKAHNIRLKYGNQVNPLQLSSSNYNSNKLKSYCELCGDKANDIHHMVYQQDANERNYINNHHKNHVANLMSVCKKCHDKIHKENIKYRKTLTSDGYKYIELSN